MHSGWIKLHRSAMDSEVFKNSKVWHLWTYILMSVSGKERHFSVRDGVITLLPGQMVFGRQQAAKDTGLSEQNIRTALTRLISTNKLTKTSTKRFTLVSVCNWAEYQNENSAANQKSNQETNLQVTNSQPTANHIQECKESNKYISLTAGARTCEREAKKTVDMAEVAIGYLNRVLGKKFNCKTDRSARGWIQHWERQGYKTGDFEQVVDRMVKEWLGDRKMVSNLRPSVLFGKNFEEYLNLPEAKGKESDNVAYISRKGSERTKYPRGVAF